MHEGQSSPKPARSPGSLLLVRRLTDDRALYEALLGDARDPRAEARVAARALARRGVALPATIVEPCAGHAPHGDELVRAGHRVLAVDLSQPMLTGVRRARPLRADACAMPIRTGVADAVLLAFEALSLFVDDALLLALLGECARVLRPDGRLLVDLEEPGWASGEAPPSAHTYRRERVGDARAEFIEHPVDWRNGTQRFEVRGRDRRGPFREESVLRLLDPAQVALVARATGAFFPDGQALQSRHPLRLWVILRRAP